MALSVVAVSSSSMVCAIAPVFLVRVQGTERAERADERLPHLEGALVVSAAAPASWTFCSAVCPAWNRRRSRWSKSWTLSARLSYAVVGSAHFLSASKLLPRSLKAFGSRSAAFFGHGPREI